MKPSLYLIFNFITFCQLHAQVNDSLSSIIELQLENNTETNEDQETEDDSYLQNLMQFKENPIDLNTADEQSLNELGILSFIQTRNFISYRQLFGKFISVYELQAIPAWDIPTIAKLRPYVIVSNIQFLKTDLGSRFRLGGHTLMIRGSQVLEPSLGFLVDSAVAKNYYMGSPQKLMLRYQYRYKNLLQYGVLGEKDPGEQFFKGRQNKGFDFYSAHVFMRNPGLVKIIALGDYSVNMGQGLVQWQTLAFRKGADVLLSKRQAPVLKPYSSTGEINFHRGIGITIGRLNWESTFFTSYKKVDANIIADTLESSQTSISSFQTSGYHRTSAEIYDKQSQTQFAFGGNLSYSRSNLRLGLNGIRYIFKYPVQKDPQPYNRLGLSGKHAGSYSIDYGFTINNMHFFGEAAFNHRNYLAAVNGLLISTAANIDMSFCYRNISPGYHSLYSNAFTESTLPANEKGFFAGISIKPNSAWVINAFSDFYAFPGLRFRTHAPGGGSDYLLQAQYRPNKQLEVYSRLRRESKGINFNPDQLPISPLIYKVRQSWRTQTNYKLSGSLTLRNRVEVVWFERKSASSEQGFMVYQDVLFQPQRYRFAASLRMMYFETEGYNSRIYAFENDVLYSYSIPVFYDKGLRYYINCNYEVNRRLSVWIKISQTSYRDKKVIGSGLDEIIGSKKTEIKLQMMYKLSQG